MTETIDLDPELHGRIAFNAQAHAVYRELADLARRCPLDDLRSFLDMMVETLDCWDAILGFKDFSVSQGFEHFSIGIPHEMRPLRGTLSYRNHPDDMKEIADRTRHFSFKGRFPIGTMARLDALNNLIRIAGRRQEPVHPATTYVCIETITPPAYDADAAQALQTALACGSPSDIGAAAARVMRSALAAPPKPFHVPYPPFYEPPLRASIVADDIRFSVRDDVPEWGKKRVWNVNHIDVTGGAKHGWSSKISASLAVGEEHSVGFRQTFGPDVWFHLRDDVCYMVRICELWGKFVCTDAPDAYGDEDRGPGRLTVLPSTKYLPKPPRKRFALTRKDVEEAPRRPALP